MQNTSTLSERKPASFFSANKLTIQLMFTLVWILIGVCVFTSLEGTYILTSFYVIVQIVTTIGYGDVVPHTVVGKLFTSFYTLGTIMLLGTLLNSLMDSMSEGTSDKLQSLPGLPAGASDSDFPTGLTAARVVSYLPDLEGTFKTMKRAMGKWLQVILDVCVFGVYVLAGTVFFATYEKCTCSYGVTLVHGCNPTSYSTCAATGGYTKTWVDSIYMCVITLATVGFGDYTPQSYLGRILWIPWAFCGVLCMARFAGSFTIAFSDLMQAAPTKSAKDLEEEFGQKFGKSSTLSRLEFSWFLLKQMGHIDDHDEHLTQNVFKHLDKAAKGRIDIHQAAAYLQQHSDPDDVEDDADVSEQEV